MYSCDALCKPRIEPVCTDTLHQLVSCLDHCTPLHTSQKHTCTCINCTHSIQLFVDKDTLTSALNNAHDTHMLAIDGREDAISQQISQDLAALMKNIQEAEVKRNRQKVVEIERYMEHQREELEALEMSTPNPS